MLFKNEIMSKSGNTKLRLDIAKDITPFCGLNDPKIIKEIFNEKLHYIVTCCIITVILLSKYNLKRFIPFFVLWFYYTFSG
jgi:hypothetical protein